MTDLESDAVHLNSGCTWRETVVRRPEQYYFQFKRSTANVTRVGSWCQVELLRNGYAVWIEQGQTQVRSIAFHNPQVTRCRHLPMCFERKAIVCEHLDGNFGHGPKLTENSLSLRPEETWLVL